MALHNVSYLIPTRVSTKKKTWLPTIVDSKDAFLKLVANGLKGIEKQLKIRKVRCEEKGMEEHLLILESTMNEYFMGVGATIYECPSFIDALDAAFKFFVVFKINFPPDCSKIWHFLNQIFYKIDLPQKPSANIISALNSFKL